jgi:hypothetical protein
MSGVSSAGAPDAPVADALESVVASLEGTLISLDSAGAPRELAARIQEALDAVLAYRRSQGG